ncbi:MAG: hypothetical protein L0323_00290 [Planctomycetes bacterium]|nr:hypothetical protein [Planctomycetota bacterium]
MLPGSLAVFAIVVLAPALCPAANSARNSAGARLSGLVKVLGDPPRPGLIDFASCPSCAAENAGKAIAREDLIVNPNGTVRDAVVFVRATSPALAGHKFSSPAAPVPLEVRGGLLRPHVLALRAGQPVAVRNRSTCGFNLKCAPRKNLGFNLTLPKPDEEVVRRFDQEEVGIRIEDNVHTWTGAWIAVLSTPFFAVTGEAGAFDLPDLPPGELEIFAWHETLGEQSQALSLGPGESRRIEFAFRRGRSR